nr:NAD-dependent epimerase/dehydratase family protein [Opitutus sp. GAS368]
MAFGSKGTPITLYGDGSQARDFTYVDDIARGTILAGKLFGGRMTEDGGQMPDGGGRMTDDGGQMSDVGRQPSAVSPWLPATTSSTSAAAATRSA